MKGVTIMTEEKSGKKIAQLDLSHFVKHSNELDELFDILIAESRKDEKDIEWRAIKKDLKKKGRI